MCSTPRRRSHDAVRTIPILGLKGVSYEQNARSTNVVRHRMAAIVVPDKVADQRRFRTKSTVEPAFVEEVDGAIGK
jgi:hypothetical protein